tara:strand:+ start:39 stop:299 length:261 start_codon:yes stop_codon:yes gene_type:complete
MCDLSAIVTLMGAIMASNRARPPRPPAPLPEPEQIAPKPAETAMEMQQAGQATRKRAGTTRPRTSLLRRLRIPLAGQSGSGVGSGY